jgi:5-methyltetrahydrofolate--homocysteine methyltransferase
MGTSIQSSAPPVEAWQGCEGCNELLAVTAPDLISGIHRSFFEVGADAVETNTFGASPLTLAEYGLQSRAAEINRTAARLAREAADAFFGPRYVFGSMGPGTKLPTLGQVSFDELRDGYKLQIESLLEGGADALLFETCQDLLQVKAGLAAVHELFRHSSAPFLYVSVTVELTGTLLIGSSMPAVLAALAPFDIDVLGLNCATGPKAMRIHLDELREQWPGAIGCMPNAGLPVMTPAGVRYPLEPAAFRDAMAALVREVGLHVVGGCCGTTPEHVRLLKEAVADFAPPARAVAAPQQAASVFSPVDLSQDPPPLFIGERGNATGSKQFRDALLANDYDTAFSILIDQEEKGSHMLDLSCAYAGRDEMPDAVELTARAARECRVPLVIDSTSADVVEAALKRYGGRMMINSINFEDGEDRARLVAGLARTYGAGLVGLTIDEDGMAMTANRKVDIARRLVSFCGEVAGIGPESIFIDPLTFTVASGDATLRTAALETREAIRRIKAELPGVRTLLGLSNISFGLKAASRKVLNAVFLRMALDAGLDACIINVAHIVPLNQIPEDAVAAARALLENDHASGDPLEAYIRFFEDETALEEDREEEEAPPEDVLARAVIKGKPTALSDVIPALLQAHSAEHILNEILVPAMKEVGVLFNDGILQLPFVLKSAEVMKKSVDMIKPFMQKDASSVGRGTMVIATVSGDVHDIGKNLVDIILSNNGFEVVNLGTKVPIEQMMAAVRERGADVLGMSGLLVKSAAVMAENMKALEASEIRVPVFLGGAALTPGFVAQACQPAYSMPVVYCKDAFEGLTRMRELADTGTLPRAEPPPPAPPKAEPFEAPPIEIDLSAPAPEPPFLGSRVERGIDLNEVYPLLNETALIRGRWGYRRGNLGADEYRRILHDEALPKLEALKRRCRDEGLFTPRAADGYFFCRGEGNTLVVEDPAGGEIRLDFPRQSRSPFLSVPDFFRRDRDVAGLLVVTLGPGYEAECERLRAGDHYQDYLLFHGFAVEVTDALAEYWHARMRAELGAPDPPGLSIQDYIVQKYRGSRYGFGYPACPDLGMNEVCCRLTGADRIGVSLSENFMMEPEVTTSALVVLHPKAKYFNV